jgi:hypothetical protein
MALGAGAGARLTCTNGITPDASNTRWAPPGLGCPTSWAGGRRRSSSLGRAYTIIRAGIQRRLDSRCRRRNIARSKLEYLYMDLGSTQLFDVVPGVAETVSFKANLARAGINTEGPRTFVTK